MALASSSEDTVTERSRLIDRSSGVPAYSDDDYNGPSEARRGRGRGEEGEEEEEGQDSPIVEVKGPSTIEVLRAMSGVYIGAFLSALDSTLIAALATPISNDFDSLTLFSWLVSAYLIANVLSQPLAGKLTDIYGRKSGMILCNVLFGVGNLICAIAGSEQVMILGRVVAGIGGGAIGPIATFVASDFIPLRDRGLWQGYANICFGIGSGLGGPLGGLIHDQFGWQWAFYLQLPLTVVATILVTLFLNVKSSTTTSNQPKYKRVDYMGSLFLIAALVLLLFGLNSGGNLVPWTNPLVLVTLTVSALSLGLFVYVETKSKEPIIPLGLLFHRTVLFACLANWFISAARFGLLFYAPVFFFVQGFSATETGLRLIPESLAIGITSVVCGLIMRHFGRYYFLGVATGIILLVGMSLPVSFSLSTPVWLPFICFALVGIGYSGMLSVTLIALIAAVDQENQAVITSTSYVFRSTGSTLGITLASAIFQSRLQTQLRKRLGNGSEASKVFHLVRDNLNATRDLPAEWRARVIPSFIEALRSTFLVLLIVAMVGAFMLLFMKEHKLHKAMDRRDSN